MESREFSLGNGSDLDSIIHTEIFHPDNLYMDDDDDDDNEPDDVIIVHMDIREPLRTLMKLVERKIGVNLCAYKFWLQDAQELEPHKNLVDQCVKGEGLVQINVQIQTITQRINIVDVLKPTEAALAAIAVEEASTQKGNELPSEATTDATTLTKTTKKKADQGTKLDSDDGKAGIKVGKPCLNWVLDSKFKKEQSRLKIPVDPNDWTVEQVKHWLDWAIKQFELYETVDMREWAITGKKLCTLTHEEFCKKVPRDPNNIFWTHLQLLKECKFVSIVHTEAEELQTPKLNTQKEQKIMRKAFHTLKSHQPNADGSVSPQNLSNSNYNNPNGQVQLWQFLLEILTDREHRNIIQWVGTDGEFKLIDPDRVARLWGEKKNKPAMNYEKLSRALRYYYDGDMISKVSGKRFAYKFDCDLKLLIGYDASELSYLVDERNFNESVYLDQLDQASEGE